MENLPPFFGRRLQTRFFPRQAGEGDNIPQLPPPDIREIDESERPPLQELHCNKQVAGVPSNYPYCCHEHTSRLGFYPFCCHSHSPPRRLEVDQPDHFRHIFSNQNRRLVPLSDLPRAPVSSQQDRQPRTRTLAELIDQQLGNSGNGP